MSFFPYMDPVSQIHAQQLELESEWTHLDSLHRAEAEQFMDTQEDSRLHHAWKEGVSSEWMGERRIEWAVQEGVERDGD